LVHPAQHATRAQDGRAVVTALRRQALRGALGMGGVSFVCNIGALAVPIYNMEVFNRVMTTHNMRTLAGLTVGLLLSVLFVSAHLPSDLWMGRTARAY
jgi:ABC-type protease/lipase transport system fused ATPase/permease subunit